MEHVDYAYYRSIYGDKSISDDDFKRLSWEAENEVNKATSGVDNVKKLKVAFPTDEDDAEAVKRCICALIGFLYQIEQAEESASSARGYMQREDGLLQGKVVSSVSAGNESISYAVDKGTSNSMANAALKSVKDRDLAVYEFIRTRLEGVSDANGVNLMYGGVYPVRI